MFSDLAQNLFDILGQIIVVTQSTGFNVLVFILQVSQHGCRGSSHQF